MPKARPERPKAKLKLHRPRPEPVAAPEKIYAVIDGIVLDDELLAKMMANLASHGITPEEFFAR